MPSPILEAAHDMALKQRFHREVKRTDAAHARLEHTWKFQSQLWHDLREGRHHHGYRK